MFEGFGLALAYFDCFCGASGDMIVGALLDAGLDAQRLREELGRLGLTGFEVAARKVRKQGFAATRFEVKVAPGDQPRRTLHDVVEIISASGLSAGVKERAMAVFARLAKAEAAVHGTVAEAVHFHEVGALDAVVDVVGACVGLELLEIDAVACSPIPAGSGSVSCEHGVLPVPAPGTAELLKGVPLAHCDEPGELTTPTGAAILRTVASSFGPVPAMCLQRVGYGAGHREGLHRPNLLRVLIGQPLADGHTDEIVVLETNLDDVSGETTGYAADRLMAAGALDVYFVPIYMKKGRPAVLLTVLASLADADRLEEIIFVETGTFGVRRTTARRSKLQRETHTVQTRFGPVRVKTGGRAGQDIVAAPEHEDCRQAAGEHGVPLREVMAEAMRAWRSERPPAES